MPALVAPGDEIVSSSGRRTGLKRGSVPLELWETGRIPLVGDGLTISFDDLYRNQPWVAVVNNKMARGISRLPLKVYEFDAGGARQRVREGRLADLLRRPWRRAGPIHFKHKLALGALIHGNGLLELERAEKAGPPTAFAPAPWKWARPHDLDRDGHIDTWELDLNVRDRTRYVDPQDVIHVAWSPADSPIGVSPLQQLGITVRIEDAAQRYQQSSFRNGARPSGGMTLPEPAAGDALLRAELRDDLERLHQGTENASRPILLPPGSDWKAFAHNAQEAELVEQRRLAREEVAAVYDVPPPLIGILEHATYSNVTEMHRMLYVTVLGPWLTLLEETLQAQLIDPEPAFAGQFVEFDLSEVLKGDTLKELTALQIAVMSGLMTINEARDIRNLKRIDNELADEPLIPANNMQPLAGLVPDSGGDGDAPFKPTPTQKAAVLGLMRAADNDTALAHGFLAALSANGH